MVQQKFGKISEVSKYDDHDCLQNRLMLFVFINRLTKTVIAWLEFDYLSEKTSQTKLESLSILKLDSSEMIRKVVIK